jgi:hypothetical protein
MAGGPNKSHGKKEVEGQPDIPSFPRPAPCRHYALSPPSVFHPLHLQGAAMAPSLGAALAPGILLLPPSPTSHIMSCSCIHGATEAYDEGSTSGSEVLAPRQTDDAGPSCGGRLTLSSSSPTFAPLVVRSVLHLRCRSDAHGGRGPL